MHADPITPNATMAYGVVVVVCRGEQFLMIRRAAGILAGGAWCFVGGGIHASESAPDAAAREFQEEVGGRVQPVRALWQCRVRPGLQLTWWLADLVDPQLEANPAEVAEIRWCTAAQILSLPNLLATNREFVERLDTSRFDGCWNAALRDPNRRAFRSEP